MMKKKESSGDRIFSGFTVTILTLFSVMILLPLINVLAKSFSGSIPLITGKVFFLPKDFDSNSYKFIFVEGTFLKSVGVSVFVTGIGTILSIVVTSLAAYSLSKRHLKGRRILMIVYIFTMVFHGGMIPDYLIVKRLGMINTVWSLIIPGMVWTYNLLIVKNFFEGLPDCVEESARIDGAGWLRIFIQIVFPMSKPIIATVCLFYAVAYWNDYFKALLYINQIDKKPLQLYLYDLVSHSSSLMESTSKLGMQVILSPEGVRCAGIVVSVIPMLLLYPFVQRYFTSVTLGAVKG